MKVSLVYPGISWSGFGTFGKRNCGECNFIHHGIASMASYLKKNGIGVDYIDFRKLEGWREFTETVEQSDAEIFGISSTTVDFDYSVRAARIIKKKRPGVKVVIGGVHPTVSPKDALKIKEFDWVVVGEGEKVILDLARGKKLPRLVMAEPVSLEEIPLIDRDLFDHRGGEMNNPFVPDMKTPFATIMTSRGCPFNCTFCQPAERMVFGGKVRLRNMAEVIEELKLIRKKYGLKSFLIHDDLFILSQERILEFARLYKESKIGAKFMCQGRADLIIRFRKELEELQKVGLMGIMIGFESGSDRVLKFLNKQVGVKENLKAAKICHKLGLKIWANYMLGIPSESYWEMVKTLLMVRRINPDYYSPTLFTPYPQTELYDYCKKNKLLIFKHYSEYRRSISGKKIRGFNYDLIRLLIFLFLPMRRQWEILRYLLFRK